MKTSVKLNVSLILALSLISAAQAQTIIFNDTFGSSTLNGTSTPGGTPSASSTSYDVASGKTGTCSIGAHLLTMKLGGGTAAGYIELQALFASAPVQLVNVGDSINATLTFTNSAGTLLAGGSGSVIDLGLFNSGGNAPVAGALNTSGLTSATTYISGYCQNWQGYVAQINYNGALSTVYTRPVQNGASPNNGVQDLLFSGAGTGLYKFPAGTQIGSTLVSAATLASGANYTESFTILLSAPGTVTIINNLSDSSGTLLSAQTNTTSGGATYTNFSNYYDGLSIGVANKGTSLNPTMNISSITISTNYYFAPAITDLTNQTVIAGNNTTLSPVVTGNPPPAFQWQTNGVNIDGETGATLALNNVQNVQDGWIYSLIATNSQGAVTNSMMLSVIVTPSVTGLNNQAVYVGDTAIINATIGGMPAPALQWQVDGVNLTDGLNGNGATISGSTTSSLSIANAQGADSGTYSLIASNSAGIVTNGMYLLVSASDVAPTLVGPTNITVIQGNGGTFTVSAYYGLPQPTLQWLDPTGTPIADATNTTLTISNVQYSQNGDFYYCVASNSVDSVTNSATLTVIIPPVITSQPSDLTVTNTQSASFTVGATGVPDPAYQWYKNGSPISSGPNNSATNATLVLATTSPADAGSSYYVQISNDAGTTNSASATLTVNSTVSATAFSPANNASGLCYDTPLTVTFSSTISLGTAGMIKIYNVNNSATPVDTIDVSLGAVQQRTFPGDAQSFSYRTISISGSTATIYPHFNVLSSNATYYVTIDTGAFRDSVGANFVGITDTNVWQFSTKVGGPLDPTNPVVNLDGSGDFLTVQGAVNSIPLGTNATQRIINIKNGVYNEIVDIAGKHNVTLRGQSRNGAIIAFPNNANFQAANAGTTHARMTFKVNANDVVLDTLTVSNSTPQGGSQAEALMIESAAKRCVVLNSEIDSLQDTILANVNSSQAYFYKSIIKGNFDYIWGGGNLYFDQCLIDTIGGASGYNLTAARTDTSATTSASFPWVNPGGTYTANGMSFVNCTFTAESGVTTVTLAGSNGTAGNNVSWYGCDFATNYVAPSASLFSGNFVFWQDANTMTNSPVTFAVVTSISGSDLRLLAATNIPTWFYGWTPTVAPNIASQPADATFTAGETATLTVGATGLPHVSYQWLQGGTNAPYPTANSATLSIPNVQAGDAGVFSVTVSNGSDSVPSSNATLTVITPEPPTFSSTVQVLGGGSVQFSFSGTQDADYRVWATTDISLTPITSTWTLVGSGTFGAGSVVFTDPQAANFANRFYTITSP